MRHALRAGLGLALWLVAAPTAAQEIPYETFTLDNGLQVVFHEDHDLPLVTVNIIYRYGSLDELPGQTGHAHLAEHLAFMGTSRVPGGAFDEIMEGAGGWNNAGTSTDYTVYYDVGPSAMLPTMLWLEADRLERMGPDMDQQKLDLQREVVRNERRQNYEVAPYGTAWLEHPPHMFPEGHPYHHPTIGSHADLIAATVEDIRDIYATGYAPSNACMVVAGDFDPEATRGLVEALFADIPGGALLQRPAPTSVRFDAEQRLVLEDNIEVPRLVITWHSPPWLAPQDAELDLVASILGEDKVGRLSKALVLDQQLAESVGVTQGSSLLGSEFYLIADARAGVDLRQLEDAIDEQLELFLAEGPTQRELLRAKNGWEAAFVSGLESIDDRANTLNDYWLHTGDPGYLATDIARYREATLEGVQGAADAVIVPERLVLWVVPEGQEADIVGDDDGDVEEPVEEPADEPADEPAVEEPIDEEGAAEVVATARDTRPADLPRKDFVPPTPEVFTLSNGLQVWYLQRDTVPALMAAMVFPTGSAWDEPGKEGLAELTADLLDEGAGGLDAAGLADALSVQGAWLSSWSSRESLVVATWTLSRNAGEVLALMRDVIGDPELSRDEFERIQGMTLTHLIQAAQDPRSISATVGWRRSLGELHPYASPTVGYADSVAALTHKDVKRFYRKQLSVADATLVVVGDPGEVPIAQLLEDSFGDLKPRRVKRPALVLPPPLPRAQPAVFVVDRPGAPQTVMRVHLPGFPADSPDRLRTHLVNSVLGGTFTSRLMQNLREDKGWTYGVRSRHIDFQLDGALIISTALQTEYTGAALDEIFAEVEELAEAGVTSDEALKAVRSYQNGWVETYGAIASVGQQLVTLADEGLPPDTSGDWLAEAAEVTVEDLSSQAEAMFNPQLATVVLVGDAASIQAQLAEHGYPAALPCDAEGNLLPTP